MTTQLPIDNIPYHRRKPVRVAATIPYGVWVELIDRSSREGRSISGLCSYLIERSISIV